MKPNFRQHPNEKPNVVHYIGTSIETVGDYKVSDTNPVVPYIGTWIETGDMCVPPFDTYVVPYIGTWIETPFCAINPTKNPSYLI